MKTNNSIGRGVVPRSLDIAAALTWRTLVVVAGLWVLVKVISATSAVTLPVAIAALMAAVLAAPARYLRDRTPLGRYGGALLLVLASSGFIVGGLWLAATHIISGSTELVGDLGARAQQIQDLLVRGRFSIGREQLSDLVDSSKRWLESNTEMLVYRALHIGSQLPSFFAGLGLAMLSLFFFLADGDKIWHWCVTLTPNRVQTPLYRAFEEGWVTLGHFSRAQVLVALADAVGIGVGAAILGLPLSFPLALVVFFTAFIPVVGAIASGALGVLIGFIAGGPTVAFIMLIIVVVVQQVESQVLYPVLMSKAAKLHAWAVLVGVAVGGFTFGLPGALFAVPLMALGNTVVHSLRHGADHSSSGNVESDATEPAPVPECPTCSPPRSG